MSYSLIVRHAAELDIQDAYQYYEKQKAGLGSEFVRAVDTCFSKIGRNPKAYAVVRNQVRRALIRKFPYGIFYIFRDDTVVVIACFHGRRSPKDWDVSQLVKICDTSTSRLCH